MAYQQRGRLLVPIKTQVVPIGDLGLPIGGVEGLQYPDDLPPVLAVNTIQTPTGPRILQGDSNGHLLQTLSQPTRLNVVAPRTDTVTFFGPDLVAPAFFAAVVVFRVTAISGAGASVTFSILSKESQGTYSLAGGVTPAAITTATTAITGFSAASLGAQSLFGPIYRVQAVISGTTPSVTWYCDIAYK